MQAFWHLKIYDNFNHQSAQGHTLREEYNTKGQRAYGEKASNDGFKHGSDAILPLPSCGLEIPPAPPPTPPKHQQWVAAAPSTTAAATCRLTTASAGPQPSGSATKSLPVSCQAPQATTVFGIPVQHGNIASLRRQKKRRKEGETLRLQLDSP